MLLGARTRGRAPVRMAWRSSPPRSRFESATAASRPDVLLVRGRFIRRRQTIMLEPRGHRGYPPSRRASRSGRRSSRRFGQASTSSCPRGRLRHPGSLGPGARNPEPFSEAIHAAPPHRERLRHPRRPNGPYTDLALHVLLTGLHDDVPRVGQGEVEERVVEPWRDRLSSRAPPRPAPAPIPHAVPPSRLLPTVGGPVRAGIILPVGGGHPFGGCVHPPGPRKCRPLRKRHPDAANS